MVVVDAPPPAAVLQGTSRQIAYAERVRSALLGEIEDIRDRVATRLRFGIIAESDIPGLRAIVRAADCIARVHRADWWIGQNGRSVHSILTDNARRILAADASAAEVAVPDESAPTHGDPREARR